MKDLDLSVIIPAYNEEEIIEECIKRIIRESEKEDVGCEILVINDGSSDGTEDICRRYKNIRLFRNKTNQGYSRSARIGLIHSKGEYVSILDADLQYNPKDMIKLLKIAKSKDLDLVIGKPTRNKYESYRRFVSYIYNKIVRILFRIKIEDVNSLKVIKRSSISRNKLLSNEIINIQLIKSVKKVEKVAQVPITVRPRKKGNSKFSLLLILKTLKDIIRYRYKYG